MSDLNKILRVEASPRKTGSITRSLTTDLIDHLASLSAIQVTERDVSAGLPFVDEDWIAANFTPAADRTPAQQAQLASSDRLVEEIRQADTLVIGTPIYNFGLPATLKAWVDQVARVGLTFRYTETGPIGLMQDKRAIVAVASGGTPVGSEIDFATPYLRHALAFIGITDVTFIAADALAQDAEQKIAEAKAKIKTLATA